MNGTIANKTEENRGWFIFIIIFLIIEYGRPQDVLPIGFMRVGMIATLILTGYLFFRGGLRKSFSKQTKMIMMFIGLLTLYIPFATNNYNALMVTYRMFLFMPLILSIIVCVDSIERLKKMIIILVGIMIYISVYGILHKGVGSGNYFKDENDLSLYINMWLPFCYFLFSVEKERTRKITYALGLLLGLAGIVLTFSRGGFLGLLAISVVCWMYSSRKLVSLAVIGMLAALVISFATDAYWSRMHTTTNIEEGTAKARIETWKAGWNMFLDYPLGVGGDNFPIKFEDYQSDYFKRGMWGRAAHSIWFTLIPEMGIFGILIYLVLLKYNIRDIRYLGRLSGDGPDLEYLRALSRAFIASLAGFFVSGTFLSVLYYPHYWYMTAIIVAAVKIANDLTNRRQDAMQNQASQIIT